MARYIADLEADALLVQATKIHCLGLLDIDTGEVLSFADQPDHRPLAEGLALLSAADMAVLHNGVKYDLPLIERLHPGWKRPAKVLDTLLLSRLAFPAIEHADAKRIIEDERTRRQDAFPRRLRGAYSLEAWGHRLGVRKGDYSAGGGAHDPEKWAKWTPEMHGYMVQDLHVTKALLDLLRKRGVAPQAITLEHEAAAVCAHIERVGIAFDKRAAEKLYGDLSVLAAEAEQELQRVLGFVYIGQGRFTPKKDAPAKGYVAGAEFTKLVLQPINPKSRPQLIRVLTHRFGWKPRDFTDSGQPKLDDEVIDTVPLPEELRAILKRYLLLEKRLGQIGGGKNAWLKLERQGRIHAEYNSQGAITGRASHSNPNIAQVPKVGSVYGAECRGLFVAPEGWVMVGSDLDSLELRMMGHYLTPIDGGAFAAAVDKGDKKLGTDAHSLNCRALGMNPKELYLANGKQATGRDVAKTFIYGFIYGAGDFLVGMLVPPDGAEVEALLHKHARSINGIVKRLTKDFGRSPDRFEVATAIKGRLLKATFIKKSPALARHREEVILGVKGFEPAGRTPTPQEQSSKEFEDIWAWEDYGQRWWLKKSAGGFLRGLDGRRVPIRSEHSALNFELQGGGALVCKRWMIEAFRSLTAGGLRHGWDGDFVLNVWVHDELITCARPEHVETVKAALLQAAVDAGRYFNLNVPIVAEAKVGRSWREVH